MKKLTIFIFLTIFMLSGVSSASTRGPQSPPHVDGPKSGPPSRAEINKLKYTKDPEFMNQSIKIKKEQTFLEWLSELFWSIF